MDVQKITHEYRLQQWTKVITECRRSGKTAKAWCEENNINSKSYYYWLKRIRIAACNSLSTVTEKQQEIVPVNISDISTCTGETKSLTSASEQTAVVININSTTIEVKNGASASIIENTLRAIKNLC
jgi:hypothetical protein